MAWKNNPYTNKDTQDKISKFADNLNNTSIKGVHDLIGITTNAQIDAIGYLKSLTEDVDKPVFKSLATDMIDLLGSFYASEEVLCCLIKNFILTSTLGEQYEKTLKSLQESGNDTIDINVDNTPLLKIIDQMIAVVDIIITFMQLDVRDLVIPNLDFAKEISDSIIGMLIIAMQEIAFTLRDASITWVIDQIAAKSKNQAWVKCIPYMNFVNIMTKYIHDYGFTNKLFNHISGVVGSKFAKFKNIEEQKLVENIKTLEFMKWIKSILVKLRTASLEWSFCVDTTFEQDSDKDENNKNSYKDYLDKIINDQKFNQINIDKKLNNILTDDNTILNNNEGNGFSNTENPVKTGIDLNNFVSPSNDEVKAFLVNYLGASKDFADQLTGFTNRSDHIQGTLSHNPHIAGNDCGMVLDSDDLDSLLKSLIRRSRIG